MNLIHKICTFTTPMNADQLKIRFLGTGTSQGIPVIGFDHPVNLSDNPKDKRLRTSVLITKNNKNVNIDCGPDFRQQILKAGIKSMEGILFTHKHNDHVLGLDDTRPFIHIAGKPMDIFGNEETLSDIRQRFPYAFTAKKYPGAPSFNEHIIGLNEFEFSGFKIQPLEVIHGDLSILGYLIDDKFAYITDASFLPDDTLDKISGVEVLVLNALRKREKHFSHYTLEEALDIVDQVKPGRSYFTHISLGMGFHDKTQSELPENVFLAYDELEIVI